MDLFDFAQQEHTDQPADERARYEELCGLIRRNNELYYAQATPEMSDAEYDHLYKELEELEATHPEWRTPDSPTQRVGNDLSEGFAKITHPAPMLSIDDIFEQKVEEGHEGESDAELAKFDDKLQRALATSAEPVVTADPTLDG